MADEIIDPDYDRAAVKALVAMAREVAPDGRHYDFPGRVTHVLAAVAAELGGSAAFVADRPGSWEAAALLDLIRSTAGYDDDYLDTFKMDLGDDDAQD